jgi:hypothetical protein
MDPTAVRLRQTRQTKHKKLRAREPWRIEVHWYECLVYPFRAWPLVLSFTAVLTLMSAGAVLLLAVVAQMEETPLWFTLLCAPIVLIPGAAIGYVCGFLDCVLTSAVAGEAQLIRWPGAQLQLAFKSCGVWLACFLAGPAMPALTAFYLWLYGGDLKVVDWLILAELLCVTFAVWLLNLLAVSQRERIRDLNPAHIANLVTRLGYQSLLILVMTGAAGLGVSLCVAFSLANLQTDPYLWLPCLAGSWLAALSFACFTLRWLGVNCYHRRTLVTS